MAAIEDITRASECRTIDLSFRVKNVSVLLNLATELKDILWLDQDVLERLFLDLVSDRVGDLGPWRGSVVGNKFSHLHRGHLPNLPIWVQSSCRQNIVKEASEHTFLSGEDMLISKRAGILPGFLYCSLSAVVAYCVARRQKIGDSKSEQNRSRKLASITRKSRKKIYRPLGEPPCPVVVSAGAEAAFAPQASAASDQCLVRFAYLQTGRRLTAILK